MQNKYLEMFLEEGAELLSGLNRCVLSLESEISPEETVREALRLAHTLKGGARMVGLDNVSQVAHQMENDLKAVVERGGCTSREAGDRFLAVLDRIRQALDLVSSGREAEALALDLNHPESSSALCEGGGSPPVSALAPNPDRRLGADRVRVGVDKLDNLQNLVDDLTLHKFGLQEHLRQFGKELRKLENLSLQADGRALTPSEQQRLLDVVRALGGRKFTGFLEDVHRLDTMLTEVQGLVFELRMVPLAEVLDDYYRAVRDLAGDLGKEVTLAIDGKFTELDKRLLEAVQGPLMHLVRNAVDHGVEDGETRKRAGKPESAKVVIRAYHKGSAVVIEVEDDGRGLDAAAIRREAVRKGHLAPEKAEALPDAEIYYLLCEPGFTTRETVTEVSGRGVGLDVVKAALEELKGSLTIQSELGRWTRFRMYLPLSISSLSVLTVRVGASTFAIPSLFVDRCIRVDAAGLAGRGSSWRYGDKVLPVVSLARMLGLEAPRPPAKVYLVAVHYRSRRMLLQVDALEEEREVVLKPLGRHLREVPFVLGVTFLPNGDPIPVLNVTELHSRWGSLESVSRFRMEAVSAPPSVLVVDDSMTTRHMETNLLQALGYTVLQASNGLEAWGVLQKQEVDLVLTDVEMPRMDGLELTRKMRSTEATADIPVVMVTTRSDDEDLEAGFLAGTDAYIPKDRFSQRELGETLRGLLARRRSPVV